MLQLLGLLLSTIPCLTIVNMMWEQKHEIWKAIWLMGQRQNTAAREIPLGDVRRQIPLAPSTLISSTNVKLESALPTPIPGPLDASTRPLSTQSVIASTSSTKFHSQDGVARRT
jgi:hypothetical protein